MTWIIEPRDTIVLRDGRPMANGATRAHTLPFPWPSSIAGLVRSRLGTSPAEWDELSKTTSVAGPWLVRVDDDGKVAESFFPAPRDAVWFDADPRKATFERRRLVPIDTRADERTDATRVLVGLARPTKAKGAKDPAPFWRLQSMMDWLVRPSDGAVDCATVGIEALPREERTHVGIDSSTRTAEDGVLFTTEHVRFAVGGVRYGLAFEVRAPRLLGSGLVVLGGERRPSILKELPSVAVAPPKLPSDATRLRVVLATPAIFREGAIPETIRGAKVVAAAVDRPDVVSGWDFAKNREKGGQPKPTRRMARAGSVYWVDLPTGTNAETWAKELWMTSISTEEQDQRDGFGLALVGVA